ncbi:MAG: carboxypeptidase-like regulatory domain-containing protein [Candidatus Enterousia sp.]
MKKLLSIISALVIALPLGLVSYNAFAAKSISVSVKDENQELLPYASVKVKGTTNGATTGDSGIATLNNVPDDAIIEVSCVGYATQEKPVGNDNSMSFNLETSSNNLDEVVVSATCPEIPARGIKAQKYDNKKKKCYPTACYEPCYRLKNKECVQQQTDGGVFTVLDKKCTLTCLSISGYAPDPKDRWKCTQDCTSLITDPNVKKAEYKGNANPQKLTCEIIDCKGKYHPSDDKQSCIPDQSDCTAAQLAAIHASAGYLITQQNKCVPKKCLEPEYKKEGNGDNATCVHQVGKPCNVKHATDAKYEMRDGKLVCVVVTCDTTQGYKASEDRLSCSKDCLSTIQATVPLATKAEYDSQMNCKIQKCAKKDGKKYIPSDDGKTCEETERDCNKETDANIWPEHATAAGYKKSKTGGTAKCVATECEDGYDPSGGKCVSVNDSDCDKKPENSKKSHRYYDDSTQQSLCLIDECKDGYKVSNDLLSCILESALSEEDAQKRMNELKENAQAMKDRENSIENKLLGAAGIGAVGIGGMNIASALSEQSADRNAEEDMKAYLATFRCDYGQGRNITGGETNIQLPGGNELIQYTTEYKQLALSLKSDKEALGMMPGIESETVFDSATTGLYDDVSIGIQKGAFTSLSRALLDENSADAAEWQKMKDDTAKKLKTGIVVAGAGAVATIAGNIAINHGKGDKSDQILNDWETKKQKIPDITLPRVPCSNFPDTTGTGYKPNCECTDKNAYFAENEGKCISCGTNERVNDTKNGCTCQDGYHLDDNNNCIADVVPPKCSDFGTTGEYPNCICNDQNAEFDKDKRKCECKNGYSNPNGGQCLPTCAGLYGVDSATASQYNVPNCPCEYSGATFDTQRNGCACPSGQHEENVDGRKQCVSNNQPCSTITGTTGTGNIPNCQCTDPNKTFNVRDGQYGCYCKNGYHENNQGNCIQDTTNPTCNDFNGTNGGTYPRCNCRDLNAEFKQRNGQYGCYCKDGFRLQSGRCVEDAEPLFAANFSSDTAFDRSAYEISTEKCSEIIREIQRDPQYNTNKNRSGSLCISSIGHTDTKYFKNTYGESANRQKNQQLSEQRAQAMYNCINSNMRTLFPNATVGSQNVEGRNWRECNVQVLNRDTPECRRVELTIQPNRCTN